MRGINFGFGFWCAGGGGVVVNDDDDDDDDAGMNALLSCMQDNSVKIMICVGMVVMMLLT